MNIIVISNILYEPYIKQELKKVFLIENNDINVKNISYEEYTTKPTIIKAADFVIVSINFEKLYFNIFNSTLLKSDKKDEVKCDAFLRCESLYYFLKQTTDAIIVWLGFEDYCYNYDYLFGSVYLGNGMIDIINAHIADMIMPPDSFIDLKRLIAKNGIDNSFSYKGKYRWDAPYSFSLGQLLCQEIKKQYDCIKGFTKKCLVLDCDNVLWGGVLSEDGIEGIMLGINGLGKQYVDFQIFVETMYLSGVTLAICSKNDLSDILKVFREHKGMVLKEEYISCFECGWGDKAQGIQNISKKLNIDYSSMVFVDDSYFEIGLIDSLLPEVATILYNRENIYSSLNIFNLKSTNERCTVDMRTQTYRTNIERDKLKSQCNSYEEYLNMLSMNMDIHITKESELQRISELSQRTNKCTNGSRYTVSQIKRLFQMPEYTLYTVELEDSFSNLGIIGAVGVLGKTIDLFAMSCRALGRNCENKMLEFILSKHVVENIVYAETFKNIELKKLFSQYIPNANFK